MGRLFTGEKKYKCEFCKVETASLSDIISEDFQGRLGRAFLFRHVRSFGSVLDIIPLADTVTKLTARCELCGKRASFTLRKNQDRQTELNGGAEVYMPVCRQHYVSGQVVIETARMVLHDKVQCG